MSDTPEYTSLARPTRHLEVDPAPGARKLAGGQGDFAIVTAIAWSLFQLYYASKIPYWLHDLVAAPVREMLGLHIRFVLNSGEARCIHLAFAFLMVVFSYPLSRWCSRSSVPVYDWGLALLGICAALYLIVFKDAIALRAGNPTPGDNIISLLGIIVLGTAVYRSLGLPLLIVALVFIFYVLYGNQAFIPEAIQWKAASLSKAGWHYWMQTEGVFGKPLEISTTMIFLFVLFGSLLEKAGAGSYFIKVSFALLGHLRGGPAKAAVASSGLSGLYSGSSIANTVTTGTFTIPLLKRTGFPAEKAGAVEVAASTNGQLMPPVMGAAAFLMAGYAGIPYLDVVKHAFLPAVISYIALFYIVHLEAVKLGLRGLPRRPVAVAGIHKVMGALGGFIMAASLIGAFFGIGWASAFMPEDPMIRYGMLAGVFAAGAALVFLSWRSCQLLKAIAFAGGLISFAAVMMLTHDAIDTVKQVVPEVTGVFVVALLVVGFLLLAWFAAQWPDLEADDPDAPITELPRAGATAITGLYFVLPIILLIWLIMIERLSPHLSAFYATLAVVLIMLAQHPVKALMRGQTDYAVRGLKRGFDEFVQGLIAGARNMTSIAIATAAAGIIVGSVSLTGMHQWIGEFVEWLAAGNLVLMLIFVAIMSLILGLGLPTTANYIVVASLMAPVIVAQGAEAGLIVPLIAAHMFVFYFGILADDTPPVGLAAFAAAGISGGDPIKTGFQGFAYDIRTAVLPFLFIFNTELLLIDVTWSKAVLVFVSATTGMLVFASATQRHIIVRNRLWETIALLLIAFTLFRPGFWLDRVQPPYITEIPAQLFEAAARQPADGEIRLEITGPDFRTTGETRTTTLLLNLGAEADGESRIAGTGLILAMDGDRVVLEEPFDPELAYLGNDFDFYGDEPVTVSGIEVANRDRIWKEIFYIPALLLLGLIITLQLRRRRSSGSDPDRTAPAAAMAVE